MAKKASNENNVEVRMLNVEDVELRVSDGDQPKITGYAAKYGKWSVDLGGFKEKIRAGAFADVMEDDVRALKNHDTNLLLGRTTSGTLRLKSNTVGLGFEIDPPNTNAGRDTIEEIRRKDISGCSFSFAVAEDDWKYNEDDTVERTIIKASRLFDVGPVTYPAYPDTTVAARSLEVFKETHQDEKEHREVVDKIEKCEADEAAKNERERQRDVERKYRKAGRIINRNKLANV